MTPPFGKTIMVMRHGHATESTTNDHSRLLSAVGLDETDIMAQVLKKRGPMPEMIICSDATRAVDTARALLEALDIDVPVENQVALYPGDASHYLAAVLALPEPLSTALIIGHNPGIAQFANRLRGGGRKIETYSPAAIACLDLPQPRWKKLIEQQALCRWFLTPAEAEFILR